MSRALVLGGGGPVGIGWEAGLVVGLRDAGVSLADADLIVGTSAGSVVGAQLAGGVDLASAIELLTASTGEVDAEANQAAVEGLQKLTTIVAEAVASGGSSDEVRAKLGRLALDSPTVSEADFLGLFAVMAAGEWPDRFACTAVDAATGAFRLWERGDGVDLAHAVASSCSVPTIYPPVTINGARYMDGGMRDMLNADVAAGHDVVVAVSCTLLSLPEGFGDPTLEAMLAGTQAQIDSLRDGGSKVETVVPGDEFLEVSGWGLNLMDFTRAEAAYQAGVRQAALEAPRLSALWTP
ncbi:patatin-like phospholipase family protein [Acidiferrimicrobium sp. IK]|uniref:patatin-like phospholipase family protein n=1 Tax=Acidiferrimicrobium sp. IK TaxID=2871700 RepID=UPI0021CB1BCD|nr:patatin-like phospholipase family protein [Acidiferrimicrobium sp. IK]MCU4186104.1 patatin-like phospholipase family protein [Acidiferrimicrobium sp. IK]